MADRLAITYRPTAELRAYARNARTHSEAQIAQLAASIQAFGWTNPVLVDEGGGLIAGHGRVTAALALGIDQVPTVTLAGLSAAQKAALVIADNKLALNAGWDVGMLAQELQALDTGEMPLGLTGFSEDELERLLAWAPGFANGLTDPDAVPAAPEVPVSKAGDVWLMGRHRVLCGDATNRESVRRIVRGKVGLIVTSPPYNQKLDSFKPSGMQRESPAWVNRMAGAYSDSLDENDYQAQQSDLLAILYEVCSDDGTLFYNHKVRYRDKIAIHPFQAWIAATDWRLRQEIIWDRQGSITLNARMFMPCDERIYWLTKSGKFVFNDSAEIKAYSTVWDIAPRVDVNVSAPFPTELPRRCIDACSLPDGLVLDPYLGSGTTVIAAEMTGRACIGIELNPAYVDVAVERWQNFTGKTATLESTGEPFQKVNHGQRPQAAALASEAG